MAEKNKTTLSPRQKEALEKIARGEFYPDLICEEDGFYARWRPFPDETGKTDELLAEWLDSYVRQSALTPTTLNAEKQRHETLHDAWLAALRSRTGLVKWQKKECEKFIEDLRAWHGGGAEDVAARKKIVFTFVSRGEGFFISVEVPKTKRALCALGQASFIVPVLRALRSDGSNKLSVALTRKEAEEFLNFGANNLLVSGYRVEGCELKKSVATKLDLTEKEGDKISAQLTITIAGEKVSAEEIRFLLDQGSSLVYFHDSWIEINRASLREALRALEKSSTREISIMEAIAFASGIGAFEKLEIDDVKLCGNVRSLIHQLRKANKDILPSLKKIDGFCGSLREYQERGVAWLKFMTSHGFGALLADDMGLGKTIQAIAWILLREKKAVKSPTLIVAPLTVLGNWKHEIATFAPSLKVYIHQGAQRQLKCGFADYVKDADIVITSYSLLVKDYALLRQINWHALILDEAQAIKNHDTQVARAARALGVKRRIALTGTPIENSATDIWALQAFLNPTFLGDKRSFNERYVKPIANDKNSRAIKKLKYALEPFILRRLKTDETIVGELGEKREIKEYCSLSQTQRKQYELALSNYYATERQPGDMFTLLTELKLICDGEGKFERLYELVEDIFAANESVLIFTQYAKVGEQIKKRLDEKFSTKFPFLYGALDAKQREKEISKFRTTEKPMAFVLSLRAGGFGLTLTKATHVIHFDRWWNPAVENQATDRAHRIGQTKTVFVHTFLTEGTLEERIDAILEKKGRLAKTLVTNGEGFLRSLSSDEFNALISLD